jgi:hypothetical protein
VGEGQKGAGNEGLCKEATAIVRNFLDVCLFGLVTTNVIKLAIEI